jgi:hypothetical protein
MTSESLERLWAVRLAGLQRTARHAAVFKECDHCRSIVPKPMGLCPWCHCYRFKEDAETVRATLREMAEVPYPVGSAVVPRINFPEPRPVESAPTPRTFSPLDDQDEAGVAQQRKREGQ